MDRAPEGPAGPAPGRRGASSSVDDGSDAAARAAAAVGVDASSGAAQAAAAAGVHAGSDAARAAAAQQAICRTLRGRPELMDAVLRAWQAVADACSAAELQRLVSAGADAAPGGADTVTILRAVERLCVDATQAGAARVAAAGLLAHAVALMRSPDPGVVYAATRLCLTAATVYNAAGAAVAREPGAVPTLLALLCGAPPAWGANGIKAPAAAAHLLGLLALPTSMAIPAAAARTGGAPAGAGGSTAAAAVLAAGGVARMVALLRAALGGGGQSPDVTAAGELLRALNFLAGTHAATAAAAAAAARAAGALPLAARAAVEAQRTPGNAAKFMLCEALVSCALVAAGDPPALAARPDLIGALAGAVALAAGGASEGWRAYEAERLGESASVCLAQLVTGGQGSSDAAAEGFLAAGGAGHLVRRRAHVSGRRGQMRMAWAQRCPVGGPAAAIVYACAAQPPPTQRNLCSSQTQ
jgi:hypothetical protein